ncbi:unnamed protein product [Rotaria sp. Silwood2]|nr:unnamed protein product [Rotaria sp. Silwood2]
MDDSQAFSHGPVTHEFTLSPMETFSSDIILSATQDNEFVHISMQPLQNEIRSPCDICCVVDTSGSMSPAAEIENDKNEHYGLSQLDLVKHALKTIINSLQDQDRLSLISFSDKATILFKLTAMNEAGKTKALDKVEKLRDEDDGNWSLAQQSLSVASAGASLSSARPALSMAPAVEWVNDQVPLPIAISIAIPNMAQRSQVDICCVIDVSGSMGEDAKFQDPKDASKFVSEVDPGLQVYGGVLFSELVHSGGEIFKGLPLKKYSDRDANSNSNNNNRNNNAIAAAVPVADSYYAGNCGGCFSGECVVQCKEQDGMVREKQLSQVRDYLFG